MKEHGNIILNQILSTENSFTVKEIIPGYVHSDTPKFLIKQGENKIFWGDLDLSLNLIINSIFENKNIYYDNGRIGVGRYPLFSYTIDIAVPVNSTETALHVGDGSFGFSFGNGTNDGFIPEVIGIGSDETCAGLYFIGVAGNNNKSQTPLIVMDGRNYLGKKITNRPIFGVTSNNYNDYSLTIDSSENLIVPKNILTSNIYINNMSLLDTIHDLQKQITELRNKYENKKH